MKKIFFLTSTLILLLILVAVASGCSGTAPTPAPPEESNPAPAEPAPVSPEPAEPEPAEPAEQIAMPESNTLLYQGHGSLRITTPEGKVIYIDPWSAEDHLHGELFYNRDGNFDKERHLESYKVPADLILVTHDHADHNETEIITNKNPDCVVYTYAEALKVVLSDTFEVAGYDYKTLELDYVTVEAVEAYNDNHKQSECVGFIITLSNGISIYVSGDTSTTEQMATLAERNLDYAFFCCDGNWNMDMDEAIACAKLVNAKHSIPYHMSPDVFTYELSLPFDQARAELFDIESRLIISYGEEITLD